MATIANTTLPEDFIQQVLARLRDEGKGSTGDVQEAILAVLHRPLTPDERWALIEHAASNSPRVTLDQDVVDRVSRGGIGKASRGSFCHPKLA